MSDIFLEVDEEVRREQLKKLFERYGHYFIALLVLIVIGVGAWRGYQYWQAQKASESGSAFQAAMALSEDGKREEAEAAFTKLATSGTSSYRTLSRFREASELGQRDAKAGAGLFDKLAADTSLDQTFRDLAAVRAGYLVADTIPYSDLKQRLEAATAAGRTFRHSARELLALAAWRANDSNEIKHWTDMVLTDPETPAAVRTHMDMLMALAAPTGQG